MKKSIYFSLCAFVTLCLCASVNAQTIRRVNNTPGLNDPNVYATAQAAHDAATPNDIISLEPSASPSYGTLTATKRINIVGQGYFLDKNPNNTFDKRQTMLSTVTFDGGSSNSTISGVSCGGISVKTPNVNISRCKINGVSLGQSSGPISGNFEYGSNCTVIGNFIEGGINGTAQATNCIISNNILFSQFSVMVSSLNSATFTYNTMRCYNFTSTGFSGVDNSIIANNIFDCRLAPVALQVVTSSNNTTVSNNICLGINGLPTGAGNINGANQNIVFTGTSDPFANYTTTGDNLFQLAAGSPALTAAAGGTQAGAFGNGANAYRLSGVPNTPIVTSFISTGSGNNTTPLSITVSVRSNN